MRFSRMIVLCGFFLLLVGVPDARDGMPREQVDDQSTHSQFTRNRDVDSVDVIVHIESCKIKSSADVLGDSDIYLYLQLGWSDYDSEYERVSGYYRQIKWADQGKCGKGEDGGLVCKRFRKKVYRVDGNIIFRLTAMDDDGLVGPRNSRPGMEDDQLGSTDRGSWLTAPPQVPAAVGTSTNYGINTKYIQIKVTLTVVGYCQSNAYCYAFRTTPESVPSGSVFPSAIALDVNETYPPQDTLIVRETLPTDFTFLGSFPPAEVSYGYDEEDTSFVALQWTFTGGEIEDQVISYDVQAPLEWERTMIGGWIYMPDMGWRSHFNSDEIFVGPPLSPCVEAGGGLLCHPGELVEADFTIANLGLEPDVYVCEAENELEWNIWPDAFDIELEVGQDSTVTLIVEIPPEVPRTTTNGIILNATSIMAPITASDTLMIGTGVDWADHDAGDCIFTVTDQGILGWMDDTQAEGSGFVYPFDGVNHLYLGSLWVGRDPDYIANRDYNADPAIEWIVSTDPDGHIVHSGEGYSSQDYLASFTDGGGVAPLGLLVEQTSWVFAKNVLMDDFVILRYVIANQGPSPLSGLYAGLFLDVDIEPYEENWGGTSPLHRLVYMTGDAGIWVGAQLLQDPTGMPPLHNLSLIHNPTYVWPDGYVPDVHKFGFLSAAGPEYTVPEAVDPDDYSVIASAGPFDLDPGGEYVVAFAVIGAESLEKLLRNAAIAHLAYEQGPQDAPPVNEGGLQATRLWPALPNPFTDATFLRFRLAQPGEVRLSVFDVGGRLVRQLTHGSYGADLHTLRWNGLDDQGEAVTNGVYLLRLEVDREQRSQRVMRIR